MACHLFCEPTEALHNMPVGQMGNYQEYLKRMPTPLREIESAPVRQHMFGNPFKLDKRMMIDEADIDLIGGGQGKARKDAGNAGAVTPPHVPVSSISNVNRGLKRKAGPIPKDFVFTPYKFRRRNTYDDDSSSDGYFSSTPSSPNPYSTPTSPICESPMYSYPDPVISIQSNGRIISDEAPSTLNNCVPESFSSLERLIETSTQGMSFPKTTSNGVGSNYMISSKPYEELTLRAETVNENTAPLNDKTTVINFHSTNYSQNRSTEPVIENGFTAPVISLPNPSNNEIVPQIVVTNHKGTKSKKVTDSIIKTEPVPPPVKPDPPPVDDENTQQKNLTLRDELYLEIRRPILSKYPYSSSLHFSFYISTDDGLRTQSTYCFSMKYK